MRSIFIRIFLSALFVLGISFIPGLARARRTDAVQAPLTSADESREKRLQWFRDARFGMMIHWGLYSVPAGEWKGKLIPGLGNG